MTKSTLIFQFRPETKIRDHERKCFDNILQGHPHGYIDLFNDILPNFIDLKSKYSSIILGGSSLMITDYATPSQGEAEKSFLTKMQIINKTNKLINKIIKNDFPTLGICFGAQLIAHHLGIPVIKDPKLAERGTYPTQLTAKNQTSNIFKNFHQTFRTQMGHLESLPYQNKQINQSTNKAIKILSTDPSQSQIHSFQLKKHIYATIFHPELDYHNQLERAKFYLKGKQLKEFKVNKLRPSPKAKQILNNFLTL